MAIVIRKKAAAPASKPEPVVKQPAGKMLDSMYRMVRQNCGPNAAVPWWLMASFMYYVHDTPFLTDALYDEMALDMKAHWTEIVHQHKHLITEEHLRAGSLYDLPSNEYPMMVKGAVAHLLRGQWGLKIDVFK